MVELLWKGNFKQDLKVVDLPDGKACTSTQALIAYLQSVGLSIDLLSSFGSDGVSVMTGRHSVVAARLCELNAQIIPVHCICHVWPWPLGKPAMKCRI